MKRWICLILAGVLTVALSACGNVQENVETPKEEITQNENIKDGNRTDENSETESVVTETEEEDDGHYTAYTYDGEAVDLFTVEEVELYPMSYSNGNLCLGWKMKVRNTSGEDIPMKEASMRVWYRYLDEKEDSLWETYLSAGYSSTIKAGRAEWMEMNGVPNNWTPDDVKAIEYIEIYGYTNTLHGSPDYEFTNPVLIKVSDFVDWDKVENK